MWTVTQTQEFVPLWILGRKPTVPRQADQALIWYACRETFMIFDFIRKRCGPWSKQWSYLILLSPAHAQRWTRICFPLFVSVIKDDIIALCRMSLMVIGPCVGFQRATESCRSRSERGKLCIDVRAIRFSQLPFKTDGSHATMLGIIRLFLY